MELLPGLEEQIRMIGERLYGKRAKESHLAKIEKEYSGKKQKEGSEHYRKMIGLPPREEKKDDRASSDSHME